MKLHKTLVQAVVDTLQRIFEEGVYADRAVAQTLKQNSKWGARDRRFIATTTYEMVRWWRLIDQSFLIPSDTKSSHLYFNAFAAWMIIQEVALPEWDEFKGVDKEAVLKNHHEALLVRKYRESIPDWLDELGEKELSEAVWGAELKELNTEASVVLRVNTLKTTAAELQEKLHRQNIETSLIENPFWSDIKDGALILNKRQKLQHVKEYKQGLFEVQDASSQLIAPFLQVNAGMTIIDACAGAGGKSLHVAALMKNKGRILSLDVERPKLDELEKRAKRGGVSIIETRLINENSIEQLVNTADRLLLDVPCSGLGVLRRNPDAKWKLSLDFIKKIRITQQDIISEYSKMLKPGGLMVYATCSILPSENQKQVEKFINLKSGEFELVDEKKVMPSDGFDGFYMALIRKG